MPAPVYENVKWESEKFEQNVKVLRDQVATYGDKRLAEETESLASVPGPLHMQMARLSAGVAPEVRAAWYFGHLIGEAWKGLHEGAKPCPREVKNLLALLAPFFRWDYGIEALEYGLESVGRGRFARLAALAPELTSCVVEATWSVGILKLGSFYNELNCATRLLDAADAEHSAERLSAACSKAVTLTTACVLRFAIEKLEVPGPPDNWAVDRRRLWLNAVLMLELHHPAGKGSPAVFRKLLEHVADGGSWPLPCEKNDRLEPRGAVERFTAFNSCQTVRSPYGMLKVHFLTDPLEILNVENAFSSCLRVHGPAQSELEQCTTGLLGWATNANVRVAVARAEDGRILGCRTIGLSSDPVGIRECPTYPPGNAELDNAIGGFLKRFLLQAGLDYVGQGTVQNTCAPAYNDQECFGNPS